MTGAKSSARWTRPELAALMRVSSRTLSRWERDEGMPRCDETTGRTVTYEAAAVRWALARAEKAAEHRAASAGRYRAEAALMEQTLAHRTSELVAKDEAEQSWREHVATVGRKLQRLAAMPAFDGCRAAFQREFETLLQAHGRVGGDGVR